MSSPDIAGRVAVIGWDGVKVRQRMGVPGGCARVVGAIGGGRMNGTGRLASGGWGPVTGTPGVAH